MTEDKKRFMIEENMDAPLIYVDGYQGVSIANGVAKFNFFAACLGAEGQEKRRIVLRLTCSIGTVEALDLAFRDLLKELKDAGVLLPRAVIRDPSEHVA
jgi:hypothetical protein